MKKTRAWIAASLILALTAGAAHGGTLGDAVGQMAQGEWRTLNQASDGSGYNYNLLISCTGNDCADNILNYASKGMWNPNTREMHFIGQGHGGRLLKHISYSEATNRWTLEAKPGWDCSPSPTCYSMVHGYEHSTLDPATGDVYARRFNSTEIHKWTRSTKSWNQLPAAPNVAVAAALEWFPELSGFVLVGGGKIHLYSEVTGSWTQLASNLAMGPYHNVATYDRVNKVVLFGGGNGSTDLYRLNPSKAITKIQAAPIEVAVRVALFTVDPASGKYLLFGQDGSFHEYDVPSNTWRGLGAGGVPIWAPESNKVAYRVAIPISTFGVIAFLTFYNSDATSKVYLYRHGPAIAAPPADTMPPSPPTGLRGQ